MSAGVTYETLVLLLVTSGLAHLPPIKVVTILSGVAHINLGLFIISAIIARGARFFVLAWLLRRYGESIRHFIEKRLGLIATAVAGCPYSSLHRLPLCPGAVTDGARRMSETLTSSRAGLRLFRAA